jgi:hypothetical protein
MHWKSIAAETKVRMKERPEREREDDELMNVGAGRGVDTSVRVKA